MNERIKELYSKIAGKDWMYDFDPDKAEMFAELIVRECMEVCKSRVGNSDYNTGRMHCVSDLKEHFGVENDE